MGGGGAVGALPLSVVWRPPAALLPFVRPEDIRVGVAVVLLVLLFFCRLSTTRWPASQKQPKTSNTQK